MPTTRLLSALGLLCPRNRCMGMKCWIKGQLWILPLIVLFASIGARADNLIVGYPTTGYFDFGFGAVEGYWPIGTDGSGGTHEIAAEFTLSSSFNLSDIDVTLGTFDPSDVTFSLSLQDGLTGSPATYFSDSLAVPGSSSFVTTTYSFSPNITLGPGTYYLVGTSTATGSGSALPPFGWMTSNGNETSNGGTGPDYVWFYDGTSSANSSSFTSGSNCDSGTPCDPFTTTTAPTYAIYGTASVPEPGSGVLLLIGVGFLGLLMMRRSGSLLRLPRTNTMN